MVAYADTLELYEYEKSLRRRDIFERSAYRYFSNKSVVSAPKDNSVKYYKRKDSAKRAELVFQRLVAANLIGTETPVLFTLTYAKNETDIAQGYRDFNAFIKALRYRYGGLFKYVSVPEFQKRGAVHFHALFWGLPKKAIAEERNTRFFAGIWGRGFLYIKYTDGNVKLSHYLSKYMAKSFVDKRLKNQKSYVASRNILRPIYQSGFDNVDLVLEAWGIVDNSAVQDKIFDTQWLGKGRYRKFTTS